MKAINSVSRDSILSTTNTYPALALTDLDSFTSLVALLNLPLASCDNSLMLELYQTCLGDSSPGACALRAMIPQLLQGNLEM